MMMSGLSGNEIYCLAQKGWTPGNIVVGNSVYSLGFLGSITSGLRMVAGGEIENITRLISDGRHAAIQRLEEEANQEGAHGLTGAVSELKTVSGLTGVRAMLMVGTASHNPVLGESKDPVTSELTGEELWNLTQMGYAPLRLVLGASVYALGFAGGITSFFRALSRGEIPEITQLIYEARENCLEHIQKDADRLKADGVIGIKVFVYEISRGLVEVMAIGTAIKRNAGVKTQTQQLLPQAIIRDRDTFFDDAPPPVPGMTKERSLSR